MKRMKRFLFVMLALILLTALASCGAQPEVVTEVIKETVVVEVEKAVEKIVTEVVEIEKTVETVVEKEVVVTATPAPGEVKLGGTLTYVINQEGSTLDPGQSKYAVELMIEFQIYDNLLWLDSGINLQPGLATSWTHNDDYTVFDLELRDDVTFHDGTPFNADAVVSWYERILDPEFPIGGIVNYVGQIESIEKTGDYAVRFTLKNSYIMFLQDMARGYSGIGSPQATVELGEEFGTNPVGTGPFIFVDWLPGSHVTLRKNPDYNWGSPMFLHSGPAYLDEIVFRFIQEDATRTAALESGDADVIARVPYADASRLAETPGLDIISNFIPGVPQHNAINVSISPTNDPLVRQAINYATDKQGIADVVYFGLTVPAYGPVTQWDKDAYEPAVKNLYTYDPEKAMALLDEAGWVDSNGDGIREKDGETLYVVIGQNEGWNEWVEYLQANLIAVGFDAEISTLSGAANNERGTSCRDALPCNGGVSVDPLSLKGFFGTQASSNWACLDDPVLDQLIVDAEQALDIGERNELIKQIQMHIMENAYEVPIVELAFYTGLKDQVKGIAFDATSFYPWLYETYILP